MKLFAVNGWPLPTMRNEIGNPVHHALTSFDMVSSAVCVKLLPVPPRLDIFHAFDVRRRLDQNGKTYAVLLCQDALIPETCVRFANQIAIAFVEIGFGIHAPLRHAQQIHLLQLVTTPLYDFLNRIIDQDVIANRKGQKHKLMPHLDQAVVLQVVLAVFLGFIYADYH
jgi:hypothetical protein